MGFNANDRGMRYDYLLYYFCYFMIVTIAFYHIYYTIQLICILYLLHDSLFVLSIVIRIKMNLFVMYYVKHR